MILCRDKPKIYVQHGMVWLSSARRIYDARSDLSFAYI